MPPQFSQQLIERYQRQFKKRFGIELTDEKANEYLHSLAGLYLLFAFPPDQAVPPTSTAPP